MLALVLFASPVSGLCPVSLCLRYKPSPSEYSQQQRYSAPLEYYLTFQGPLDSVLSCVRPLSSSPSLFGGIFEFRGTYEVKKINLATERSTSVPLRSRGKSASKTIGLDIFIKSLHMKCRFISARPQSGNLSEESKCICD